MNRPGRPCEEHIFTLTTITRNQFAKSKPLFTSFIDLKKAFDWVDRDMLMNMLLIYGINGKIIMPLNLYIKILCNLSA